MTEKAPSNVGPHDVWALTQAGFRSTAAISDWLGVSLTRRFVMQTLGVPPDSTLNNRGCFWSPESQERIRRRLIEHLERLGPTT